MTDNKLCILYSIILLLINKPRTTQSMKKVLQTTILNMKVLQTPLLTGRPSSDLEDDNISEEQKHSTFAAMMNKFHEIVGGLKEKLILSTIFLWNKLRQQSRTSLLSYKATVRETSACRKPSRPL